MEFEIRLIYIFFRSFLLISLMICGKQLAHKKRWRWYELVVPVLIFGLIEGLRYMRGIDYMTYYFRYQSIQDLDPWSFEEDPLFVIVCQFLKGCHISYQGFIILCSFFLIISGLFILKDQKKYIAFSLPLFASFMYTAENLIRWYWAFSFLMIALHFWIENKKKNSLVAIILAGSVHLGIILVIPIYILVYYIKRPLLSPFIACIIYLILLITFKIDYMLYLTKFITLIADFGRYSGYVDNLNVWLTGSNREIISIKAEDTICFLYLIIYGHKLIADGDKKYLYFYNLFLIGAITYPMMQQIELAARYNQIFIFFSIFIAAKSIYHSLVQNKKFNLYSILAIFYILWTISSNLYHPLVNSYKEYLFIWDAPYNVFQ